MALLAHSRQSPRMSAMGLGCMTRAVQSAAENHFNPALPPVDVTGRLGNLASWASLAESAAL